MGYKIGGKMTVNNLILNLLIVLGLGMFFFSCSSKSITTPNSDIVAADISDGNEEILPSPTDGKPTITPINVVPELDDGGGDDEMKLSSTNNLSKNLLTSVPVDSRKGLNRVERLHKAVIDGRIYVFATHNGGVNVFRLVEEGEGERLANAGGVSIEKDNSLKLRGASGVTTTKMGETTYLFVVATLDSAVTGFEVNPDSSGNLVLTKVVVLSDGRRRTLKLNGAVGIDAAMINGEHYLFVAGNLDKGVNALKIIKNPSSNRLSLARVYTISIIDNKNGEKLGDIEEIAIAEVGGTTYLFTGVNDDTKVVGDRNGIFVSQVTFSKLTKSFGLKSVENDQSERLGGVAGIAIAEVDGMVCLFAAGYVEHQVTMFEIGNDGVLDNVANVSDDGSPGDNDPNTLKLRSARGLAIAEVGEGDEKKVYLFAIGHEDNGMSVFRVENRSLLNIANIPGSDELKLGGASDVETVVVAEKIYFFVAGILSNGISVFRFKDD